jgi:hypothetical protein
VAEADDPPRLLIVNYLQLCQRLARECGVNGTGPAAVAGQTGELARIVNWVQDAWLDIQGDKKWKFQWESPTLTITAGNSSIAGTIPEDRYDQNAAYLDDGSARGRLLDFFPWDEFRHEYRVLNNDDNVTAWTIKPDGTIAFNALVTVNTDVAVERFALPVTLLDDDDIPAAPEDLHMIIVWRAMVKYANFDEAGVQRTTAVDEFNAKQAAMFTRCLPQMRLGGPLGSE